MQRPLSLRLGSGYGPMKPGMLCARVSLGVQQETCCWQFSDSAAWVDEGVCQLPSQQKVGSFNKTRTG